MNDKERPTLSSITDAFESWFQAPCSRVPRSANTILILLKKSKWCVIGVVVGNR